MTQAPTDRHGLSTLLRGGPESAVAQHRSFSRYVRSSHPKRSLGAVVCSSLTS